MALTSRPQRWSLPHQPASRPHSRGDRGRLGPGDGCRARRRGPRVEALLSELDAAGWIPGPAYRKWVGAHWVLAALADLDYPPGDESLVPLREMVVFPYMVTPLLVGRPRSVGAVEAAMEKGKYLCVVGQREEDLLALG